MKRDYLTVSTAIRAALKRNGFKAEILPIRKPDATGRHTEEGISVISKGSKLAHTMGMSAFQGSESDFRMVIGCLLECLRKTPTAS